MEKKVGTGIKTLEVVLPWYLQPRCSDHLIRLGKDNDGGYLVDSRDIYTAKALVSAGINDDWSFEAHFYSINEVPIYAYDASVSRAIFIKMLMKSLPVWACRPRVVLERFKNIVSYERFFQKKRHHIKKYVGMDGEVCDHVTLGQAFEVASTGIGGKVFVKIDIEGAEYRILDDLVDGAELTSGLVIEFHDTDLHIERIADFMRKYPLNLVHVHCNNAAPINKRHWLPFVVECTFTSSAVSERRVVNLPHCLDMPNASQRPDYHVAFSDVEEG